jgi:hypothetical protein
MAVINTSRHYWRQMIRPQARGVPWMAIAEPTDAIVVTSDGPLGNIGFPSSTEGVWHLREMLDRTAQRLNSEDLDKISQCLLKSGQ